MLRLPGHSANATITRAFCALSFGGFNGDAVANPRCFVSHKSKYVRVFGAGKSVPRVSVIRDDEQLIGVLFE